MKVCSVEGCGRRQTSRGLCPAHAWRQRNGRPLDAPVRFRITKAERLSLLERGLKRCPACSTVKPVGGFRAGLGTDGLSSACAECDAATFAHWADSNQAYKLLMDALRVRVF